MTLIDIILLILLGGFVLFGFWFGIIHSLGALFGVLIGAGISTRYFETVTQWIHPYSGGPINVVRIVVFIILFILINRLVGFVFYVLDKTFRFALMLPFLAGFNRLGGAVIGLVEGALVLGLILYFSEAYPISDKYAKMILEQSSVAHYLLNTAKILMPLLPQAMKDLESVIFKK